MTALREGASRNLRGFLKSISVMFYVFKKRGKSHNYLSLVNGIHAEAFRSEI